MQLFSASDVIEIRNETSSSYNTSNLIPGQTYNFEIVSFGPPEVLEPGPKSTCIFTTGNSYQSEYLGM